MARPYSAGASRARVLELVAEVLGARVRRLGRLRGVAQRRHARRLPRPSCRSSSQRLRRLSGQCLQRPQSRPRSAPSPRRTRAPGAPAPRRAATSARPPHGRRRRRDGGRGPPVRPPRCPARRSSRASARHARAASCRAERMQRRVGRIADEGVLEDVPRGRAASAHVQELGVHQPARGPRRRHVSSSPATASSSSRSNRRPSTAPTWATIARRRAGPRRASSRSCSVSGTARTRRAGPRAPTRLAAAAQRAGVAQRQHELLGEQRHAVAALIDRGTSPPAGACRPGGRRRAARARARRGGRARRPSRRRGTSTPGPAPARIVSEDEHRLRRQLAGRDARAARASSGRPSERPRRRARAARSRSASSSTSVIAPSRRRVLLARATPRPAAPRERRRRARAASRAARPRLRAVRIARPAARHRSGSCAGRPPRDEEATV